MSSSPANNDDIRRKILELLYAAEQNNPMGFGVERDQMINSLQAPDTVIDFNVKYLVDKRLAEFSLRSMGTPWNAVKITAFGIDVVEHKAKYVTEFSFIQTANIQQIQAPVYGPVVQGSNAQISFNQQLVNAFQQAYEINEKQSVDCGLKTDAKKNMDSLKEELEKIQPDVSKIQKAWDWLKRNANWVVPTLTQIVVEGLRRAVV